MFTPDRQCSSSEKAHHLRIAGIDFALELPDGVELAEHDPCYQPFLGVGDPAPGHVAVPVRIGIGEIARPSGPPDFDTGSSWTAYRDGSTTRFHLDLERQGGEALWSALYCEDPFSVRVVGGSRLAARHGGRVLLTNPVRYPLDQLLVAHILSHGQGLIVHAAGMIVAGSAFVFVGASGAGKTTLMRLLSAVPGIRRLSDDRIVLRRITGHLQAHGTPWAGEGQVASPESAELGGLIFLRQGPKTRLVPIEPSQALRQLLPAATVLWYDGARVVRTLGLCDELLAAVPSFELHFTPDESVVEALAPLGLG